MIQLSRPQHVTASLILLLSSAAALAQTTAAPPTAAPAPTAPPPPHLIGSIAGHPGWPVAKPADVSSPEAILNAVYSVISGPQGQPRDWDRMRSLFIPDARLIPTVPANGHADAVVLTIDGYIARASSRMATMGFYESSVHNVTEQYGNIVQVWSTYESRHAPSDATPFVRGINSFQLLKDGDRYWIVNIYWDAETPDHPIPAQYLPAPPH
ncbi:MAG TPA: nuclear transport factor 2 family protein [Acidobacteriaceae bacterium]|jgi:hypothetical protein|nr:nuclear transport factor 2 family protein [Acidobacteriaceae bacterium]